MASCRSPHPLTDPASALPMVQVWRDARTVNVIAAAALHKSRWGGRAGVVGWLGKPWLDVRRGGRAMQAACYLRTRQCPSLLASASVLLSYPPKCSRVMLAALKFFMGQDAAEEKGDGELGGCW